MSASICVNLRFAVRLQTRQHFVEQQYSGLRGERLRHFERLQLGQREFGRRIARRVSGQLHELEDLGRARGSTAPAPKRWATARFSATVSVCIGCGIWNVRPMPRRARA